MNTDILKGKWNQIKGDLKSKWGQITENEWTQINGDREKLIGKLQEKYGHTQDRASREVDEFLNRYQSTDPNLNRKIS